MMIGELFAGMLSMGGLIVANYAIRDGYRPMVNFLVENYQYPLRVAEIGVYWGTNAMRMIKQLDITEFYLIDPYIKYKDYDREQLIWMFMPPSFTPVLDFLENRPKPTNVIPLEMTSEEAAPLVPNELDAVYIDGNHAYEYVKKDIELYYKKVKHGGVIGGHDIAGNEVAENVQRAVFEFADTTGLEVFIDTPDWWIVKP